jgi:hypothetical protein
MLMISSIGGVELLPDKVKRRFCLRIALDTRTL